MRLRIVSGRLGGRYIQWAMGSGVCRPTKESARESIAEALKARIAGATVADLCAGSGAFGFEMISRGASAVCFVDSNRQCTDHISRHAQLFGVGTSCRILTVDVKRFARKCAETFDIIFYDPPYDRQDLLDLAPELLRLANADGILVCERRCTSLPRSVTGIPEDVAHRRRTYGRTVVDVFTRSSAPPDSC